MPNDLGTKFTCHHCGTKFYDMKKPAPICPKCGTDQRDAPPKAPERKRAAKVEATEEEESLKEPEAGADEEEEEEAVEEEEDA